MFSINYQVNILIIPDKSGTYNNVSHKVIYNYVKLFVVILTLFLMWLQFAYTIVCQT